MGRVTIEMRMMGWPGPMLRNPPCSIEELLYCALFPSNKRCLPRSLPVAMTIQGLRSPCKLPCKLCVQCASPLAIVCFDVLLAASLTPHLGSIGLVRCPCLARSPTEANNYHQICPDPTVPG